VGACDAEPLGGIVAAGRLVSWAMRCRARAGRVRAISVRGVSGGHEGAAGADMAAGSQGGSCEGAKVERAR
jgi:nanoRNase/pAp phosphatase (c-di-AMP/oligoRNAs hydrolase)